MSKISKESSTLFEKTYFQRTILQLNQKLYGLNERRFQLLAMLTKEKRSRLLEELSGLERLTSRLVSQVKPTDYQFVKVQVGGNPVLLSQAVLVRRKRVNKRSVYRLFVRGRMNRIINRLHLLRSNWDTYYRAVHMDARNHIMGIFMTLNKKYSFYLSSCMVDSSRNKNQTPQVKNPQKELSRGNQRKALPVKSEKKTEPLIHSQEKKQVEKVYRKVEEKRDSIRPRKPTLKKESLNEGIEVKSITKLQPDLKQPKTKTRTATQETNQANQKAKVEKNVSKKGNQETKNSNKKKNWKPLIKKEQQNDFLLDEMNEEIYLDSIMGDLESSHEAIIMHKRNKYMDDMVLK